MMPASSEEERSTAEEVSIISSAPRTHSSFRLVAFNTGVQFLARGAGAIIGVVQAGILSRYLHSDRYGEFAFIITVIGMCAIITDLGLGTVTVRSLAQGQARARTMGSMIVARVFLALVAAVCSDLFALVAPLDATERTGILLMSALYVVTIPGAVSAVFQAELELQYPLALTTIQSVLALGLTLTIVVVHGSILAIIAVQLAATALGAIAVYVAGVRRYHLSFAPSLRDGTIMLREALPVGIGSALVILYYRFDALLLGLLRGPAMVGHYTAAYKFVDLANFGAAALMGSIYPLLARKAGEDDVAKLVWGYAISARAMLFVAIPLATSWFLLASKIIFLIYPAEFEPAVQALRILSWVLIPLFMNNVLAAVMLSLRREKTLLWISLGAAIVNVGLNIIFIPTYGIAAASLITVLSELFVTACGIYSVYQSLHHFPQITLIARVSLASTVMAAPVYLLRDFWPFAVVAGGITYLGLTRMLGVWSWDEVRGLRRSAPAGS